MTGWKGYAIITKLSRDSGTLKREQAGLSAKNFRKERKKCLTNLRRCDKLVKLLPRGTARQEHIGRACKTAWEAVLRLIGLEKRLKKVLDKREKVC